MPKVELEHLTEQQRRWFTSIREGLQRETGKSLDQWVEIAKGCPESKHRARLAWFKQTHGLLQNRASYVLAEAFPAETGWSAPKDLRAKLWPDPLGQAILDAVEAAVLKLPDVVIGQRKTFFAWSRNYQFAALRPVKGGTAMLGLAVGPEASLLLEAPRNEGWSERLKSRMLLGTRGDVTAEVAALVKQAWERS